MLRRSKRTFAALLGIGFALFSVHAAEPWQVVSVTRLSWEGALQNGAEFELRVESKQSKQAAEGRVVSEIVLKLGGKEVEFPEAAFNDLINVRLQSLSMTSQPSGEVKLRFTGGDADATYEVEYLIKSDRLVQRTMSYFEADGRGQKSRVVKTTTF